MKNINPIIQKIANTISILFSIGYMQSQLLKPDNGDILNYIHILFQWTQSSGADEYQLQIADINSDGTVNILDIISIVNLIIGN